MAKIGGNPQNLVNFKKGQSGNPKGRTPKLPHLDKLLDEVLGEEKNNITAMKAVLMSLLSKATKGDVRAAEVLLDRAYGKAKQIVDSNINGTITNVISLGSGLNPNEA